MPSMPDFYSPIYYSIIKRRFLIRPFPGLENVQINYSQLHQDMFVLCLLDGKRNGTYLEIGANEPVFISNSYLLESTFGWKGFSLDTCEEQVRRHQKMRTNKCYCQDATTASYEALLAEAQIGEIIDYLSVDADPPAVTLAALKNIPHEKCKFRVITYEHDYSAGGSLEREESRRYLSALGYQLIVNDISWNNRVVEDWWAHPDLTDKAIIKQLSCVDTNLHEHDKYIYGAYRSLSAPSVSYDVRYNIYGNLRPR